MERPSHLEDACPVCQRETWKTVPVKIASKSQILRYKLNNQGGGRSLQWKLYGADKRKVVLSSRVMGISVVRTSPAPEETRRLSARLSELQRVFHRTRTSSPQFRGTKMPEQPREERPASRRAVL